MKEYLYNYQDFKAKVDTTRQIHHSALIKPADQYGAFQRLIFRIYGLDKNHHHIIIFETSLLLSVISPDQTQKAYQKLVQKYAKPLGSTEGRWQ